MSRDRAILCAVVLLTISQGVQAQVHDSPGCSCPQCVPELTTRKTTQWGYRAEPTHKCIRRDNPWRWLFPCKANCADCKMPIPCQALWKRTITTECPTWRCELYPKEEEASTTSTGAVRPIREGR
jgi:hypothetical protein